MVVRVFDSGDAGRRRGRIFQRFWDHVEVERAGGSGGRWTQGMNKCQYPLSTSTFAPLAIQL